MGFKFGILRFWRPYWIVCASLCGVRVGGGGMSELREKFILTKSQGEKDSNMLARESSHESASVKCEVKETSLELQMRPDLPTPSL